jgi:hypothetical protein
LIRFGDGKHRFYLESVRGNPVVKGDLCINCEHLLPQTKTQDVKTFPHGNVLGDYTSISHIFDSPWYHTKIKTYGPPSKEDIELAMEAQKRSRAGKRTKTIKELLESLGGSIMVKETKKSVVTEVLKKKKIKKIEVPPILPLAVTTSSTDILENRIPLSAIYVESMDDSIEVEEVIVVALKKEVINGRQVWKESDGNRVYEYLGPCKKGELLGCIDSESGEIVDVDDE